MLIGFAIAAPVGPIGLLCIQRTLQSGRRIGLATGLGAASADAMYGIVAAFGLSAIAVFLSNQRLWLGLMGGLFLCWLGWQTWRAAPPSLAVRDNALVASGTVSNPVANNDVWAAYGTTFVLTLTNPMTIFSFMAVFAGLGLAQRSGHYGSAGLLVAGVFLGSTAWWLLLTGVVAMTRRLISTPAMVWVNRSAGLLMSGFGLYLLSDLLRLQR